MTYVHAHLPWHLDVPRPCIPPLAVESRDRPSGLYQSAISGRLPHPGVAVKTYLVADVNAIRLPERNSALRSIAFMVRCGTNHARASSSRTAVDLATRVRLARRRSWGNDERSDEPVPVAAIDRLDELDDLARLRVGDALEAERRRVERNAERRRLLLVGHRRLDRLRSADDDDPVAVAEELVERLLLEIARP